MNGIGGLAGIFPDPEVVIGKSLITRKLVVGTSVTLVINNNTSPKAYMLMITNQATPLYIGGPGVTVDSGFPISSTRPFIFGMLENTKLYAIALTNLDVYVLDMGL